MSKIEIGAGFIVTAFASMELLQSVYANIALLTIGAALILHGGMMLFSSPIFS